MAGLKYWVWLSEVKGLTNRSKLLLLDYFGTPENVYYADEDEYRLVEGIEPRQIALLAEKSLENADRILGACSRLGLRLLTMQDADYPMRLRNIFEPPCLLYVKGRLPVIDEEVAVAMVGTRKASPYGIEAAEKIAYGLCKQGAVVISGAAAGVDSASHRGALRVSSRNTSARFIERHPISQKLSRVLMVSPDSVQHLFTSGLDVRSSRPVSALD